MSKINELIRGAGDYRNCCDYDDAMEIINALKQELSDLKAKQAEIYNQIGEWAKVVFPDAGSIEHMIKLKIEAQEVIVDSGDITEYADCFICLFAAAYKMGFSFPDLLGAIENKFEINKQRNWAKLPDGTYQHK